MGASQAKHIEEAEFLGPTSLDVSVSGRSSYSELYESSDEDEDLRVQMHTPCSPRCITDFLFDDAILGATAAPDKSIGLNRNIFSSACARLANFVSRAVQIASESRSGVSVVASRDGAGGGRQDPPGPLILLRDPPLPGIATVLALRHPGGPWPLRQGGLVIRR